MSRPVPREPTATFIIAEPGGTHDGKMSAMHALIDMAADAGASAIKPQWTSSPARMCERRGAQEYLAAYQRLAYPIDWHADLRRHARARGLDYVVSIYLPEDAEKIAPYADAIKIASFEASDVELRRAAKATGLAVFVSTGMMSFEQAVAAGRDADRLFHCVSAYPAPLDSLNLSVIAMLKGTSGCRVGFSDHSRSLDTGAIAVAAGADALEVHVMLDDCDLTNPDAVVALDPEEFAEYVERVREAEIMLGTAEKRIQDAEAAMLAYRVLPTQP